jgi:two-component system, NtrC family, sensor kinase
VKLFRFKTQPKWRARRRWREERKAILEFNRSLSLIADPQALMASIAARIKELFGTDRIVILRAFEGVGIFSVAFSTGFNADELKDIRLTRRDRLTKWLLVNETALVVGQNEGVFNYLGPAERDLLRRLDLHVILPLLEMNSLTGVMFLSSSKVGWKLSVDDLNLLQLLVSQASIAFENAYLYQQQRDRFRRLYRSERLAAAGQLAASIAHEIRNPLTVIRSTVQFLLSDFDKSSPKRQLFEGVIDEVDRIDRTVDGLLSLTRRKEFKPERIGLTQLIEQSLLLVRRQAENQAVTINAVFPTEDLYIMGDESHLKQLFLNLILNALQAMPNGGTVEIFASRKPDLPAATDEKEWVQVTLRDTGCGIPAEDIDKVFDPFFTTKQGGTGLGLFTSYAIAREHSAELEISSQQNEGTTVTMRFP